MSKLLSKFHIFDVFHVLMSTGHVIALIFRFCLETFHVVQIWVSLMFMPTNYLICRHRTLKQNVEQTKHSLEGKCSLWCECVLIATHNSLDIGLSSNIRHIFFSLNSIGCGTHSLSRFLSFFAFSFSEKALFFDLYQSDRSEAAFQDIKKFEICLLSCQAISILYTVHVSLNSKGVLWEKFKVKLSFLKWFFSWRKNCQ